jgi:hypothetical protein
MRSSPSIRVCLPFLILLAAACGDSPTPATTESEESVAGGPQPAVGSGGLVAFAGNIESMSPAAVIVDGQEFLINRETVVKIDGTQVPLSAIHIDDFAIVKAKQKTSGAWAAREIRVRGDARSTVKITGRIESADSGDFVVEGRSVRTTPDTFYAGAGNPQSSRDVRVGFLVVVTGLEEIDHSSVEALKIRVLSKQ